MIKHIKTILAAFFTMFAVISCEQEVADVSDRLDDLEKRVSALEQLCKEMNSNISSLQGIVTAMQTGDYITSVNPVTSDGKTVGYTITFAKGNPVTIYHGQDGANGLDGKDGKDGQDGADGHTPVICIQQDTDGIWYWTVDGQWLLDGNGQTWTQLGKAVGENDHGGVNGDSMFQSVTVTDTDVTFVTSDGQSFTIKRASALSIEFDSADLVVMGTNATRDIHYTISSGIDDITIEALSSADIKVKVDKVSAKTGTLTVKTDATIDEYSKVVVLVNNGSQAIMRTLTFEEEAIRVEENTTKEISDEGGEIILEFFSNASCYAWIPDVSAQSWISIVPGTKAMPQQTIMVIVEPNTGAARSATVFVQSEDNLISLPFVINQDAKWNDVTSPGAHEGLTEEEW